MLKLNCGLSFKEQSLDDEVKKVQLANKYNIDYVSVISIEIPRIKKLWETIAKLDKKFILCSAPIYESVLLNESFEETIKRHASYGVKAMTFHITPISLLMKAKNSGYIINSRGGEFLMELYEKDNTFENPYYSKFFELCQLAKDCGVNEIFLGTSLRPGACNSLNKYTAEELKIACDFYDKLENKYNMSVQIEAFGHVPYSEWPKYKEILGNRKICAMGPLLTDSVNGYDEINAIIGYTMAKQYGFNFTTECMLSRKEHIGMPELADVEDEMQKWRVADTCIGVSYKEEKALADEKKVIDKKDKQRTQCSAHINIFGPMDIPIECNTCGDRCPLLHEKQKLLRSKK